MIPPKESREPPFKPLRRHRLFRGVLGVGDAVGDTDAVEPHTEQRETVGVPRMGRLEVSFDALEHCLVPHHVLGDAVRLQTTDDRVRGLGDA